MATGDAAAEGKGETADGAVVDGFSPHPTTTRASIPRCKRVVQMAGMVSAHLTHVGNGGKIAAKGHRLAARS